MWLLAAICKRYGIQAHAYCLMGNHFHLVLYCTDPNLSSAMRDLKSRYAKYYNRRHKGTGPVFEGPFVEVPILDDEHLMIEIRYVHRNPFDLNANASITNYPWSSHGLYLGLRPQPHFVVTRIGHRLFGPNYRRDIEAPRASDKVQNLVPPILDTPGVSRIGVGTDWSLAGIRGEVANAARCDIGDVRTRSHNGLLGIAALIALREAGFSAAEIADPYGFRSRSAAHSAAMRAEARLTDDASLRIVYDLVRQRMRPAA